MDKLISDEVERTAVRRLSLSLAIIGIISRCTNIFNGVSSSRVWLVLYASSLSSLPYNTPVSKHNSSARLTGKHSSVLSLSLSCTRRLYSIVPFSSSSSDSSSLDGSSCWVRRWRTLCACVSAPSPLFLCSLNILHAILSEWNAMQFNRLQLDCSLALFTYRTHTHREKHCIDKVSKLLDDDAS